MSADVFDSVDWTKLGSPPVNDGSIERVDLDRANRITIVSSGGTYTPKQLHLDVVGRKLYWVIVKACG